jgi:replication-associated recombination protein RarA
MAGRYNPKTVSGHDLSEVASAFQKSIRRGLEQEALYWGTELDMSNYGEYAWKRMKIMCSEDVGLAEPLLPAVIESLYQNWVVQRKKKDQKYAPERLFFVHAILLLVRAKKSRIVDHALMVFYEGKRPQKDIPDYALDKHTLKGKRMGRSWDYFFEEGIKLENRAGLEDYYLEAAREIMTNNGKFPESLFELSESEPDSENDEENIPF